MEDNKNEFNNMSLDTFTNQNFNSSESNAMMTSNGLETNQQDVNLSPDIVNEISPSQNHGGNNISTNPNLNNVISETAVNQSDMGINQHSVIQNNNINQTVIDSDSVIRNPNSNTISSEASNLNDFGSINTKPPVVSDNSNNRNYNKVIFVIVGLVLAVLLVLGVVFGSRLFSNNEQPKDKFVSIDVPIDVDIQYDAPYLKQTIRTLVYDENKKVTRVIFSDVYDNYSNAKKDFDSMVATNGKWGMNRIYMDLKDNTITYEYDQETLEEYYEEFLVENVDELINEYGDDRIIKNFKPNIDNLVSSKEEKEESKKDSDVNYDIIASEVEKRVAENYNKYYKQMYNKEISYVATVDKASIQYTDKFSETGKYYVMEVIVSNPKNNVKTLKFYARCNWDTKNNTIKDYSDNTRIITALTVYENAVVGMFVIGEDQYKNEKLWDNSDVQKDNFLDITSIIDEINYFYFDSADTKNEFTFEKYKQEQIGKVKKVIKCKKINIYIGQLIIGSEGNSISDAAEYLTINLYLGKNEDITNTINFFKQQQLYYEELYEI